MKSFWRFLRRWHADHWARANDLFFLLVACGASCALVFGLDLRAWVPDAAFSLSFGRNVLICLVCACLFLLLFAWRRWREIDDLLADADTDVLTGVGNRRKIERVLAHEFDRALRYGRPLSVVMIDIDHFKQVNDRHGHAVGDAVLSTIVRRIGRRMRACDHFGRWGGEEFLLICPETDTEGAMMIANRMRRTVKQRPMRKAGVVTASFGVSSYHGQGDYETLVDQADCYLYMAKDQGRDRVMSRLIVMDQMQAGNTQIGFMSGSQTETSPGSQLSTLMSTIAAPLRRLKRR